MNGLPQQHRDQVNDRRMHGFCGEPLPVNIPPQFEMEILDYDSLLIKLGDSDLLLTGSRLDNFLKEMRWLSKEMGHVRMIQTLKL